MIFIASSVFYRVCTVHPNIVQIQYVHVIFAAGACMVGGASYSIRTYARVRVTCVAQGVVSSWDLVNLQVQTTAVSPSLTSS